MIAVSASPIEIDKGNWAHDLSNYKIDGSPVLNLKNTDSKKVYDNLLSLLENYLPYDDRKRYSLGFESRESILKRTRKDNIVTDNNMGREWRMWPYNERKFGVW